MNITDTLNLGNIPTNNRKIYDCFILYNELDLLEIRLNELNEVVDYFVIVEAEKTFQNSDKILYYDISKDDERFSKFKNKIIHIIVPHYEFNDDSWYNEEKQFNFIKTGISNASDDDIIVLGFSDEIPKPSTLAKLKNENLNSIGYLLLNFYYFYLNTKYAHPSGSSHWCGNLISPKKFLNSNLYNLTMYRTNANNIIPDGGWHFSFLGDSNSIIDKINSYAHTEFRHLSVNNIENFKNNLQDPLGRNGVTRFIGLEDVNNLPIYVQENILRFEKLLKHKIQ